ncbi:hypothetical protein E5288_WYG017937 [Bos mutus]|uniref:Uncharacterized protein n=1 Tax=Bos mutus TaxID=72004 RepID=A0A6B0S0W3_9CETA|nr:hypothetical protein [Bos mutus]
MKSVANDLAATGDNTRDVTPGHLPASPPPLPAPQASAFLHLFYAASDHLDHDHRMVGLDQNAVPEARNGKVRQHWSSLCRYLTRDSKIL